MQYRRSLAVVVRVLSTLVHLLIGHVSESKPTIHLFLVLSIFFPLRGSLAKGPKIEENAVRRVFPPQITRILFVWALGGLLEILSSWNLLFPRFLGGWDELEWDVRARVF